MSLISKFKEGDVLKLNRVYAEFEKQEAFVLVHVFKENYSEVLVDRIEPRELSIKIPEDYLYVDEFMTQVRKAAK